MKKKISKKSSKKSNKIKTHHLVFLSIFGLVFIFAFCFKFVNSQLVADNPPAYNKRVFEDMVSDLNARRNAYDMNIKEYDKSRGGMLLEELEQDRMKIVEERNKLLESDDYERWMSEIETGNLKGLSPLQLDPKNWHEDKGTLPDSRRKELGRELDNRVRNGEMKDPRSNGQEVNDDKLSGKEIDEIRNKDIYPEELTDRQMDPKNWPADLDKERRQSLEKELEDRVKHGEMKDPRGDEGGSQDAQDELNPDTAGTVEKLEKFGGKCDQKMEKCKKEEAVVATIKPATGGKPVSIKLKKGEPVPRIGSKYVQKGATKPEDKKDQGEFYVGQLQAKKDPKTGKPTLVPKKGTPTDKINPGDSVQTAHINFTDPSV